MIDSRGWLQREGWLIQIFSSHTSPNDEIAALLEARMEARPARLQIYRREAQAAIDEHARQVGVERPRELWQITLDYGIDYYQSELAWLEKTLERVHNLPPLVPSMNS